MEDAITLPIGGQGTGEVLIEISNKTMIGLILPEIVYNIKKKLSCILQKIIIPNH